METTFLYKFLDFSEEWAILIPLCVLFFRKPVEKWKKPLIIYLVVALYLGYMIDFGYKYFFEHHILKANHIFYNINSIIRLILISWFFHSIDDYFKRLSWILPSVFLVFSVVDFWLLEDIFSFCSILLATEAAFLMIYCITWFNLKTRDDKGGSLFSENYSWVIIGISLYASVNFFIFLFYTTLIERFRDYAMHIWNVHNIMFTVMCILFAIAFYKKNDRIRN